MDQAVRQLNEASISTARLDVLVLLEDCTSHDRAYLLAHPELQLSDAAIATLEQQIKRRADHEPLAYIRGRTEFYGREFIINSHVLEPRPESETIIELLKALPLATVTTVIDVGTGSGALAITAALELPDIQTMAIDIDAECLKVARQNSEHHNAGVKIVQGDLLSPLVGSQPDKYALLCNLPYVPESFHINQAATHEPPLAIFGGPDGLAVYRKLFKQISDLQIKPLYVITESMPPQHEQLIALAAVHSYAVWRQDDFVHVFKRDSSTTSSAPVI